MKFTIVLASLAVLFTSALALPVEQNLAARDIIAREPTIAIDARDYLDDLEERDFDEELEIYARGSPPYPAKDVLFCQGECNASGLSPAQMPLCMQTCRTFFLSFSFVLKDPFTMINSQNKMKPEGEEKESLRWIYHRNENCYFSVNLRLLNR